MQRKRREVHMSHAKQHSYKIITESNSFFDFCLQVFTCQKGLQGAPPTAITASPCNVARTEHLCFPRTIITVCSETMEFNRAKKRLEIGGQYIQIILP